MKKLLRSNTLYDTDCFRNPAVVMLCCWLGLCAQLLAHQQVSRPTWLTDDENEVLNEVSESRRLSSWVLRDWEAQGPARRLRVVSGRFLQYLILEGGYQTDSNPKPVAVLDVYCSEVLNISGKRLSKGLHFRDCYIRSLIMSKAKIGGPVWIEASKNAEPMYGTSDADMHIDLNQAEVMGGIWIHIRGNAKSGLDAGSMTVRGDCHIGGVSSVGLMGSEFDGSLEIHDASDLVHVSKVRATGALTVRSSSPSELLLSDAIAASILIEDIELRLPEGDKAPKDVPYAAFFMTRASARVAVRISNLRSTDSSWMVLRFLSAPTLIMQGDLSSNAGVDLTCATIGTLSLSDAVIGDLDCQLSSARIGYFQDSQTDSKAIIDWLENAPEMSSSAYESLAKTFDSTGQPNASRWARAKARENLPAIKKIIFNVLEDPSLYFLIGLCVWIIVSVFLCFLPDAFHATDDSVRIASRDLDFGLMDALVYTADTMLPAPLGARDAWVFYSESLMTRVWARFLQISATVYGWAIFGLLIRLLWESRG